MVTEEYSRAVVVEEREQRTVSTESQQHQRQLPQNTIQLAAVAGEAVASSLGKSPAVLGIVVLNISALVAAVYFLNLLISGQQQHLKALLDVQTRQQTEIVTLHKAEFDALLEMSNRLAMPLPSIPPPPQPPSQPPPRGAR